MSSLAGTTWVKKNGGSPILVIGGFEENVVCRKLPMRGRFRFGMRLVDLHDWYEPFSVPVTCEDAPNVVNEINLDWARKLFCGGEDNCVLLKPNLAP